MHIEANPRKRINIQACSFETLEYSNSCSIMKEGGFMYVTKASLNPVFISEILFFPMLLNGLCGLITIDP